jgi:hypothetical protein
MNEKDFRVQIPLWNIALLVSLLIWSYGAVYAADLQFNNVEDVFVIENNKVLSNWNIPAVVSFLVGFSLFIAFTFAYFIKLNRHNKENPHKQISAFTFLKLGEFMDDDEMLRQVTQNATKKVYILYSQTLPLLIVIMFLPFNRYIFIVCLLTILILHHALYYREIRKYINGKYSLTHEISPSEKAKIDLKTYKFQKRMKVFSVALIVLILTISTGRIFQIKNNSDRNMIKAEDCMDRQGTVVVESGSLFTLSSFTCEEN